MCHNWRFADAPTPLQASDADDFGGQCLGLTLLD